MSTVHVNIEIEAPVERVWETIMDPHRLKDWVTIHRSVSHVSEEPLASGASMDQSLHIRGVSFKVHWDLTEVRRSPSGRMGGPRACALARSNPV